MPHYTKGDGRMRKKRLFKSSHHMAHWLTRIKKDHEGWNTHFVGPSKNWLAGKSVPPQKLRRSAIKSISRLHPHELAGKVLHEDDMVGGGITEALYTLGNLAANTTGLNFLKEKIFGKADRKEVPNELQYFAKALNETYSKMEDRPDKVGDLKRLSQLDTDRYSVWLQPNNQLLVTIHGTRMEAGDLLQDFSILAGNPNSFSSEVNKLFKTLDKANLTYDVAAHSLATDFVINGLQSDEHVDGVYLFSPASSALQDTDLLKERANNPDYTYFINPSDTISHPLWQEQTDETMEKHTYVGDYKWNPLTAHGLEQWFKDIPEDEGVTK